MCEYSFICVWSVVAVFYYFLHFVFDETLIFLVVIITYVELGKCSLVEIICE